MPKAKKRSYTLADMQAMVEQMGGRMTLEVLPAELHRVNGRLVKKCDYCDRTQDEVEHLIVNPTGLVHICSSCARQCLVIVEEDRSVNAGATPSEQGAPESAQEKPSSALTP